jgi:hypothetical protein
LYGRLHSIGGGLSIPGLPGFILPIHPVDKADANGPDYRCASMDRPHVEQTGGMR